MAQRDIWEKEYNNPKLVSFESKPQKVVKTFKKFLHRKANLPCENIRLLDLGSGLGKHSFLFAACGARTVGLELSSTAVRHAIDVTPPELASLVQFIEGDMGEPFPFENDAFNVALDVMSSNSLLQKERENYIRETARVLERGGWVFVRGLALEGDENAKILLNKFPGPEERTYRMPGMNLLEKVFTRSEFEALYSKHFEIEKLERVSAYTPFEGKKYKRNYWIGYMKKK